LYGRAKKGCARRALQLQGSIASFAASRKHDVLIFAECAITAAGLLTALNALGIGVNYQVASRSLTQRGRTSIR
jgi:hypothetical protein